MSVTDWMIAIGVVGAILVAIGLYLLWSGLYSDGAVDDVIFGIVVALGVLVMAADAIWAILRWLLTLD